MSGYRFLARVSNNYYSYATGSWVDLGVPASDTALISLFQSNGQATCPTQAQLELLGTGTARPVRCCWQESAVDAIPIATVKAIPKDKLFLPKSLITMQSFEGIDNMTPTYTSTPAIADETGKIWTNTGNPILSNTQKKIGDSSLYLNGTNYTNTPTNADFNFGTGDFTIDWWEYKTSLNTYRTIFDLCSKDFGGMAVTAGTLNISSNGSNWDIASSVSLGTQAINVWEHYAIVRSGNTFYIFKDGTITTTFTSSSSIYFNSPSLVLGFYRWNGTQDFHLFGYIDEFRVLKGIARWTSNFTPPTSAYTVDSNTISLLHFEKDTEIRFIVTKDLTTYYTYNFTNSAWEVIDHTNLATVKTNGITESQLSTIQRAKWDLMTTGAGLAIGYLLSQGSTLDTNYIDSLNIQVDMKGSWDKAIHGTDYTYGYPQNNLLRVKLLTSGDYKINYCEPGAGI